MGIDIGDLDDSEVNGHFQNITIFRNILDAQLLCVS